MAIIYDTFTRGVITDFIRTGSTPSQSTNRIVIYKGTMPASDAWSEAGSSADELVRYGNFTLTDNGTLIYFSTAPVIGTVNATGTGTATWGALFNTGTPTRYLLGTVSGPLGNGIFKIDDINVVSGSPVSITSIGIRVGAVV